MRQSQYFFQHQAAFSFFVIFIASAYQCLVYSKHSVKIFKQINGYLFVEKKQQGVWISLTLFLFATRDL